MLKWKYRQERKGENKDILNTIRYYLFIYEIGVLYLSIAAQAMIAALKNRFQEE